MSTAVADAPPARSGRRTLVVAAVAALVLGGFVLLLVGADRPTARSELPGKPAPGLTTRLPGLYGDEMALSDLRGRYVVVNFFASWCQPCVQEHPELVRFAEQHAALGDAAVVQVLFSDRPGPAREFFAQRGGRAHWPVLLDESGRFALDYGVTKPPETYLIDPRGFVLAGIKGAVDQRALEDLLAKAKAGRPS